MNEKYSALFTPWKIGNVEIKNRIVLCPMGGTSLFGWFELTGCKFDQGLASSRLVSMTGRTRVRSTLFLCTAASSSVMAQLRPIPAVS